MCSQINWVGSAIFTFFVLAFGFYLWVHITKTMDLGHYLAYGIYVLVVEARSLACRPCMSLEECCEIRITLLLPHAARLIRDWHKSSRGALSCFKALMVFGLPVADHGRDGDDAVRHHVAVGPGATGGIQKSAPIGRADKAEVGSVLAEAVGQEEEEGQCPRRSWLRQRRARLAMRV